MFLLVTGASGAGKSTVRQRVARELAPSVECVELDHLVSVPAAPDVAWRQRATEAVVQHALELQADRRHLLLSGDPVAAGEVLAAPSAVALTAVAVCLLDVSPEAQAARLARRGDDPALLPDHQAFAAWMRGHARDPRHMPYVVSTRGWEAMRWERWTGRDPATDWGMEVLDTSERSPAQVAAEVVSWAHRALNGQAPLLHARGGAHRPS